MANEFVARKGLISSGSIRVSGSVTASYFVGDGSQLTNIATSTVLSSSLNIDTYTFVGNGVTTNYVLSQSYDPSSLLVSVDGLSQTYVTDYTLATSTISFISAPPSQSNILIKAFVNVAQGATGSFSGSFFGIFSSASYALTASYAANAGGGLSGGTVSSSAQYPGWVTASSQIDYNSIQNKLSDVVSSSTQFTSLTAPFSGSFTGSHIGTVTASALQILNTTDTAATNKVLVLDTATNQVFTTASVGGGGGTGTVGPGTVNSIALFNASSTISSSNIFQSTNNIGIGTTAPVARLSVVDAGNVQSSIAGTDVTAYSQLLLSGSGRAFGVGVGNASETTYGVANEFFLFDHNAAAMRLAVDTIGNVGVGTTAPGVKLEVNGEISASAFISGSLLNIREMSMLVSGTIAAPGGTTVTLNLNNANYFAVSASGTGTITWVVTNPPPTGRSQTIIIEYINGGVVTNSWFTGTRWSGGVAPTLTSGANPDVLGFITDDAGTNWRGVLLQRNSS